MLRAIVVDDELITANLIGKYLEDTGMVRVEKIICNPLEVIMAISKIKPDVVFLDIEMPEITGIELSRIITEMTDQIEVVFITAHGSYAIEAFKVNALDFVSKPIDPMELDRVIRKIIKRRPYLNQVELLKIITFGDFRFIAAGQNKPIKWRTAKCEELVAYMLFKTESYEISKWKLIDVLWPEKDEKKSEINLRSTVFRINKTFEENGIQGRIIANNNSYRLQLENYEVDAFQLEKIEKEWLKNGSEVLLSIENFNSLYPGHLFDDLDYHWCESLQNHYLRTFINLSKAVLHARIMNNVDLHIIYKLLDYSVEIDPYNEDLREIALNILYRIEGKNSMTEYYIKFQKMLMIQLGVKPKESLNATYESLMNL